MTLPAEILTSVACERIAVAQPGELDVLVDNATCQQGKAAFPNSPRA